MSVELIFMWGTLINEEWTTCIVTIWKEFEINYLSQACNVLWGYLPFASSMQSQYSSNPPKCNAKIFILL